MICGIDWVTQKARTLNIKVANMSLAGFGFADGLCGNLLGDALNRAICRSTDAGVTYVAAAGNSGQDFSISVPAAYPEVLTVTAMSDSDGAGGALGGAPTCRTGESDDRYASFSNFADPTDSGGQAHMVAAPGVCIDSTWLGGRLPDRVGHEHGRAPRDRHGGAVHRKRRRRRPVRGPGAGGRDQEDPRRRRSQRGEHRRLRGRSVHAGRGPVLRTAGAGGGLLGTSVD